MDSSSELFGNNGPRAESSPWQTLIQQFLNIYEERASQLEVNESDTADDAETQVVDNSSENSESYYEYIQRQRKLRKKKIYQKKLVQMKHLQLSACRVLQGFYKVIKAKNRKSELARFVENKRIQEIQLMESEEIFNKINKILHLRDTIDKIDKQKQVLLLEVNGNIDTLPDRFQPRNEEYRRKLCGDYITKLFDKNIQYLVKSVFVTTEVINNCNSSVSADMAVIDVSEISSILDDLICEIESANSPIPVPEYSAVSSDEEISSLLDDLIRSIENANFPSHVPNVAVVIKGDNIKLTKERKKEEFLLQYNIMKSLQQQAVRTLQGFNRIVIAKNIVSKIHSANVALQEQEQMLMFHEESYGQINNILHIRDTISRINNEKELLLTKYQQELEKISLNSPLKRADGTGIIEYPVFVSHSFFVENIVKTAVTSILARFESPRVLSKPHSAPTRPPTRPSTISSKTPSSSSRPRSKYSRPSSKSSGIMQQIDTSINWDIDINLEEYIDENVREYADEILRTPSMTTRVVFSDSPDTIDSPGDLRDDDTSHNHSDEYSPLPDYRRQHIEDMKAWNAHSPTPPTQEKPSKIPHRIKPSLTISTDMSLSFKGSTPQYLQSNGSTKSANSSPTSMYNEELINKLSEEWGIKNKNIIKTIIKRKHILTESEESDSSSPRLNKIQNKISPTSLSGGRNKNYKNSFKKWRKWN